jgi:hypothetical protein
MKRLTRISVADIELAQAAERYNSKSPGLGVSFLREEDAD